MQQTTSRIGTPWTSRLETPRQGCLDGPTCRIKIFDPWIPALDGIELYERLEVLYWLHLSRRDLVRQSPGNDGTARGTFSLRTPVRPNPIGTSIVRLVSVQGNVVQVRGLDCPQWNAATRPEARPDSIHPDRSPAKGGLPSRRSLAFAEQTHAEYQARPDRSAVVAAVQPVRVLYSGGPFR